MRNSFWFNPGARLCRRPAAAWAIARHALNLEPRLRGRMLRLVCDTAALRGQFLPELPSAELVCSAFLVLGLATRFGAFVNGINMTVAFFIVHKTVMSGEHSGELAFIYLAGYSALLIAGPGQISMDQAIFGGKAPAAKT